LLIVTPLIAPPPIEAEASDPTEVALRKAQELFSRRFVQGVARVIWSAMNEQELAALPGWIANVGLRGSTETTLLEGFCGRAVAVGLPLARAIVIIDTLHPIYEGRAFRWERGKPEAELVEYGSSNEGELAERWRKSPLYRVWHSGG
jgi:hypothetical protein